MLHLMVPRTEPQVDENQQVQTVEAALQHRFAGRLTPAAISKAVSQGLAEFSEAPVRTFVPLLLQKRVTDRLRQSPPA